MKSLFFVLIFIVSGMSAQAQNDFNEEIRKSWGLNVGFGTSSGASSATSITVLTPGYLKYTSGGWIRFYGELVGKSLDLLGSTEDESVNEFSVGVQVESPIMNDIFGFYSRFGLGSANFSDGLYDGNVPVIPIALGFNLYSKSKEKHAWYDPVLGVEFRTSLILNYDSDKEVVSNADSLLGSSLFFKAGWLF